jgi:hypothetical protein
MQLNLLDAIVTIRAELLLSNICCKDFIASLEMLRNVTSDKVCAVCSTNSSGDDSDDTDLELFIWSGYEICIKICLAFFFLDFFLVLFDFTFKCRSGNPAPVVYVHFGVSSQSERKDCASNYTPGLPKCTAIDKPFKCQLKKEGGTWGSWRSWSFGRRGTTYVQEQKY